MSDPTPTTKEERAAAAEEQRRVADEQAQQRAQQQATALRALETDVLSMAMRAAATDSSLDWGAVADALDRVSAATRVMAGKK